VTPALESTCAAIVVLYVAIQLVRLDDRRAFVARFVTIAVAAWLGEDSMIRAYGFYRYASVWHGFLDQVPLLIVLIWPVVVDSAERLARSLTPGCVPRTTALLVLADACLIEPIAVHAKLWSWNAPGAFGVPPVGVLGWAAFAWGVTVAPSVLAAPLIAHAFVLAAWWAVLRWVSIDFTDVAWLPVLPWILSLVATWATWRRSAPRADVLVRAPGAAFFFALLTLAPPGASLLAWALAFVPPYVVLLVRGARPAVAN
jgi:hypothetical protein